ncbi:siphovirus Gp157 family protein [Lactobacillus intestinalis]|uniref:siphovirus Gp157 family protein n=1 Tax=Lactobacillus intestinalis TaxID=151781 RepID=UPI00242FCC40|nr:siphovirus Gp157 family protein [Lactobacillus intestinalis]
MNVFELNTAIKQVQEMDIDSETLADTLESLELPRNEKLDNVASWIEENKMKIEWLKGKRKQLSDVETQLKKQTDRLQDFLTQAIDDSGKKEIQTENHLLKPRNYRDSVIVEATKDLPIDYVIRKEVIQPDKKLLYKDLKAGKKISGAHLKSNRKTVID